jgi:hypothetical protein
MLIFFYIEVSFVWILGFAKNDIKIFHRHCEPMACNDAQIIPNIPWKLRKHDDLEMFFD